MRNVCDAREARRRHRHRWPPKQLERGPRRVEAEKTETAGGGSRRRGCDSISLGTVILQRLPKLKRLDCFQRTRMTEQAKQRKSVRWLVRRGTNTFLMKLSPRDRAA